MELLFAAKNLTISFNISTDWYLVLISALLLVINFNHFLSDYIQCPHCLRRFNPSAADRHIPVCGERTRLHGAPVKPLNKRAAADVGHSASGIRKAVSVFKVFIFNLKRHSFCTMAIPHNRWGLHYTLCNF